jgi:hypothetical protein
VSNSTTTTTTINNCLPCNNNYIPEGPSVYLPDVCTDGCEDGYEKTSCIKYYGPEFACLDIKNGDNLNEIIAKFVAIACAGDFSTTSTTSTSTTSTSTTSTSTSSTTTTTTQYIPDSLVIQTVYAGVSPISLDLKVSGSNIGDPTEEQYCDVTNHVPNNLNIISVTPQSKNVATISLNNNSAVGLQVEVLYSRNNGASFTSLYVFNLSANGLINNYYGLPIPIDYGVNGNNILRFVISQIIPTTTTTSTTSTTTSTTTSSSTTTTTTAAPTTTTTTSSTTTSTTRGCLEYSVFNFGAVISSVSYTDCFGLNRYVILTPGQNIIICVLRGTTVNSGVDVSIFATGNNCTGVSTPTTTTTSTSTTTTQAPKVVIQNQVNMTSITTVTGISGFTLPQTVENTETVTGFHNTFTGQINVTIGGTVGSASCLYLVREGVILETINVTVAGVYTFQSQPYASTDLIYINFITGVCTSTTTSTTSTSTSTTTTACCNAYRLTAVDGNRTANFTLCDGTSAELIVQDTTTVDICARCGTMPTDILNLTVVNLGTCDRVYSAQPSYFGTKSGASVPTALEIQAGRIVQYFNNNIEASVNYGVQSPTPVYYWVAVPNTTNYIRWEQSGLNQGLIGPGELFDAPTTVTVGGIPYDVYITQYATQFVNNGTYILTSQAL